MILNPQNSYQPTAMPYTDFSNGLSSQFDSQLGTENLMQDLYADGLQLPRGKKGRRVAQTISDIVGKLSGTFERMMQGMMGMFQQMMGMMGSQMTPQAPTNELPGMLQPPTEGCRGTHAGQATENGEKPGLWDGIKDLLKQFAGTAINSGASSIIGGIGKIGGWAGGWMGKAASTAGSFISKLF